MDIASNQSPSNQKMLMQIMERMFQENKEEASLEDIINFWK